MSDIVFYYAPDANPISLRVIEQHHLGSYQVITANQLVLESNRHIIPDNCAIIIQCKIGDNYVSY